MHDGWMWGNGWGWAGWILGLAKYEERYVIPSVYVNQRHQQEETATEFVLSFDGGPECTSRVHSARPPADQCSAALPRVWLRSHVAGTSRSRFSAVPVQQVDRGRVLGVGDLPAYFQVRVMIFLTLFALWPFTRLVHAFSAPIGYLFRPDVVYRSRDVAAKDELVGLHTRAAGPLHSTTRLPANVGCGRGLVVGKRHAPAYLGPAARRCAEFACPAKLFGALSHVGQAAAAGVLLWNAAAVVDNLDSQEVSDV